MGRKQLIYSYEMWPAAVTLGATATSAEVDTAQLDKASIELQWTGAPIGVITVQARNGDAKQPWYTLDFGGTISIDGNATNHQLILSEMSFTAIRLLYTRTSGTGTLSAVITAKTDGA